MCWLGGGFMDKKQDLRIVKTREAIKEAFIELIEEKGFDALTIKDITEKARINRGTFYAHYEDKYHCMSSYETEFLEGLIAIAKSHYPLSRTPNLKDEVLPIAIDIFHHMFNNKKMLKAVLSPKGDPYFQSKLKQSMWEQLFEKTTKPLIDLNKMLVPPEYFAAYIAGAHLSVIQVWLNNDCKETPEEMAKVLSTFTKKGPFYAAGLIAGKD